MSRIASAFVVGVFFVTAVVLTGPSAAYGFDANRTVRFRGARMSCQQVYNFSEDHVFAGKFQELRKSAVKWRQLAQQVQEQLNRGARWSRVNNVLRELTHVVGAVDTIRSIVTGGGALQGAKAVILGSLGLPDVSSVQGSLHAINVQMANANDRTWTRLKGQLQSQLRTCLQYAEQYQRDSNEVIQALVDARRVLQAQCR